MRLIKMLGLAAVVAAAFSAFAVASATAESLHPLIKLCTISKLLLCPAANRPKAGGTLKATQIGTGKFEGGLFTEECTGATAEGTLAADEAKNMIDDTPEGTSELIGNTITAFNFTGCKPCTSVKVNGLPLAAKIQMTDTGEEAKKWFLKAAGSATFEGCTFGAKCKFGGKEIITTIEMNETTGSILNTAGTELKLEEGSEFLCGGTGKWFAKFSTTYTPPGGTAAPTWLTLLKKGEA